MAIGIDASVGYRNVQLVLLDNHKERITKTFSIDATVIDATVNAFLTAFFSITNCACVKGRIAGRKITGMPATPATTQYDLVSAMGVLTFTQISPENPELTLYKEFVIPALAAGYLATDKVSIITPDSAGDEFQVALNTVVTFLQANLVAYIKSADRVVTGGWTYQPAMSGFITSGRKFDGQPG